MVAFLFSNFELTIVWLFLAVPTGVALVRYRAGKKKAEARMGGCLTLALVATSLGGLLITFSVGEAWWRTRPDKMLSTFLQIDDRSEFSDLRSNFVGGLDYTAWIYFRTSPDRLHQLTRELGFERRPAGDPNQSLDFAGFSKAPELPSAVVAVVYFRKSPENHNLEYIVTNPQHDQAWFVSLDY